MPATFFAFRTCALPMRVLTAWADGVEAPGAAPEELAAALDRDRTRLRERLAAIAARPDVEAALYVASPDVLDAWRHRPADPGVEAALVRYVVRMASRATPFGLFAACGVGVVGDRTQIELPASARWGRFTQLDANYLDALVREWVATHPDDVSLTPNDSLHLMGGRWRYVEARLDGLERSHHLVEVAGSKHLERAIEAARAGVSRRDVIAPVADGGVDETRAAAYVDRLVAAQVLVPSLAVAITGPPPLDALIDDLAAAGDEATTAILRETRDRLAALDAEGPAAPAARHAAVAETLTSLAVPIDRSRLLHVDATVPPCGATLARSTIDDIGRGLEVLGRIGPARAVSDLDRFREAFRDRYDDQEVPLLEALDEELGVGFGVDLDQRDPAPLLAGLHRPAARTRDVAIGTRERRLLELLHRAWSQDACEIVLTKEDVAALSGDEDAPRLPAAVAATAVPVNTADGLRLVFTGATGPSGARLLGRFCHADPELERHVREHLRAEEAQDPEAVYAEIVHLPSGRMVNVLARPMLRDHEIAWLGRSGLRGPRVLPAADLVVSVRNDRVVLRSRRLDRRVVPRLTSAHNYDRRSPGVYRFLCALQADGAVGAVGWTWLPYDHVPFTPRVRLGSLILARARWWATGPELRDLDRREPVARWQAVQAWRARRRLPRWICLVDDDNVLPIDLDNVLTVDTFVRAVRRRADALLEELLPGPEELVAAGPDGARAVELVIPLVRPQPPDPFSSSAGDPRRVPAAPPLRRVFPPGSEWTYLKLYAGSATADRLLAGAIAAAARELVDSGAADGWFFLRYADPRFHLRVRFHGDPDAIRPAVDAVVARVIDDGLAYDAEMGTYRREIERYGGPDGMLVAERLFHADSEAVVDLLGRFEPGAAGAQARWRIGVLGAERWLADLGLDGDGRREIARRAHQAFDREFGADAPLRKSIAGRVRDEWAALDELLRASPDGDHPLAAGVRVLHERSSAVAPLAAELRALRDTGRLARPIEDLAVSVVHMWLNRMCRSDPRFHEYVTYALLTRVHEVRARRPS